MYYLLQKGIHFGEVHWIGESLEQGRKEADLHAEADEDDWHEWRVYEYQYGVEHEIVYTTRQA